MDLIEEARESIKEIESGVFIDSKHRKKLIDLITRLTDSLIDDMDDLDFVDIAVEEVIKDLEINPLYQKLTPAKTFEDFLELTKPKEGE